MKNVKCLHISDSHMKHRDYPESIFKDIDICFHTGDASNSKVRSQNEWEMIDFLNWYEKIPVPIKIFVPGNHDTSIEAGLVTFLDFKNRGIILLNSSGIRVYGQNIFGVPYTPTFGLDWVFMKSRETIGRKVWELCPENVDILLTHGPPKGILDTTITKDHKIELVGDSSLKRYVDRIRPKFHLFGHIHNVDYVKNTGLYIPIGETFWNECAPKPIVYSNAAGVLDGEFDKGITYYGNLFTFDSEDESGEITEFKI